MMIGMVTKKINRWRRRNFQSDARQVRSVIAHASKGVALTTKLTNPGPLIGGRSQSSHTVGIAMATISNRDRVAPEIIIRSASPQSTSDADRGQARKRRTSAWSDLRPSRTEHSPVWSGMSHLRCRTRRQRRFCRGRRFLLVMAE